MHVHIVTEVKMTLARRSTWRTLVLTLAFAASWCLTARGLAADAHLLHLEVTQGIQDDKQSVPLLQNRPTYIRAYFNAAGTAPVPVAGQLTISDPSTGEQMDVPSITSIGSKLDPRLNNALFSQRQDLQAGLVFKIPVDWLGNTTIMIKSIQISKRDAANTKLSCDNCSQQSISLTFLATAPLKLHIILLSVRPGTN